ncbi:MAG: hypothetical protein ACRES3_02435, partial [Steroidobacteraceae bacterium]
MIRILSCALAAVLACAACGKESPSPATTEQAQAPAAPPSETVAQAPPSETVARPEEAPASSDGESIEEATTTT